MHSVKGSNTARARLAALIVVAVQALGLQAASPQEPAQPRIDEEMIKQEKIYNSRDADVPEGYITGRTLLSYLQVLPSGFCGSLGSLGSSDRWLDIGAGAGQAILDYYAPADDSAPGKVCSGAGGRVSAVALSIEDRRTDKWRRQAARFGDGRMQYLAGRRLRQYSSEELGKFSIITDVFGGFSYTEDLSGFLERTLRLLETGGVFYTLMQSVHLADGKDNPNTSYLTELVDAAGRDEKVCSWLKRTTCVEVTCESKSNWQAPTEQITVKKVCAEVSVPRVKVLKYEAGDPPGRRFKMEP
ncbi:MAG TPA: class I SAM-dependent methyltransferase [Verrucomicrobiae bacterium]|jgi:SAM-dependent methyltransferase|nr:class I SAM-dependent methyltransferase [Verrucomicrobiae bacterium]